MSSSPMESPIFHPSPVDRPGVLNRSVLPWVYFPALPLPQLLHWDRREAWKPGILSYSSGITICGFTRPTGTRSSARLGAGLQSGGKNG